MANENNAKATKEKKPGFFKRIGKWFRDTAAELKKVSWPSFATVLKQTGIVLGVVLAFLVVLMLFDLGLGELYKLLVKGITAGVEVETEAALMSFML
jgi:preprotein translocase subunit SecE